MADDIPPFDTSNLHFPTIGEGVDAPTIFPKELPQDQIIPVEGVVQDNTEPRVLTNTTEARLQGHEWPAIDQHISQFQQNAEKYGYTPQEVDQHLGYRDPQLVSDRLQAIAQSNLSDTETSTDHPITTTSSGIFDPNSKDGLTPGGDVPATIRGTYSQALLNGEVKGPADFTDMFKQAAVKATDNPDNMQTADLAHGALQSQFPDNKELTDTAIGLAQQTDTPLSASAVDNIKSNLMRVWTETGIKLQDIYQQAVTNPMAADMLTKPPIETFGPLDGDVHLNKDMPTEGVTRPFAPGEYLQNKDGSWSNEMTVTTTIKGKPAVVPGLWLMNGKPVHVSEDQAGELAEKSGLKFPTFDTEQQANDFATQREAGLQTAKRGDAALPSLWTGKVGKYVPQEGEPTHPDAINTPNILGLTGGNMTTDPTGLFGMVKGLAYLPGAEMDHREKVEKMAAAKNNDGTPTYTDDQIFHEKMESPTLKLLAQILAAGAVGKGYDALTSGDMETTLKALANDETGAMKNPLAIGVMVGNNLQRMGMTAADRAAWIADKPKEYAQSIIREGMGVGQREYEMAAAALEPFVKRLNEFVPEFKRELAMPRGSNFNPITGTFAPRSTIRNFMDNIEGVQGPGVVPINPGDALHPIMTAIKMLEDNAWKAIDDRIQSGAIEPVGFVQDRFAHMWSRPDEAIRMFGGGRQGSSKYLSGRSIPTMADGIDAGLTPKILNPIESELLYWRATRDYLTAADIRATAMKDNVVTYQRDLNPGWAYLNGRGSVKAALDQNGNTITMRAQAPKQFASAYNSWVGRGVYDWPTVSVGPMTINPGRVYDKLQMAANMMTGLKLAVSAYHYKNIAQEQLAAGATEAWGNIAHAELGQALKNVGYTATLLPRLTETGILGRMGQRQYLGLQDYGPEMEHVVDLLTRANTRFTGRQRFGSVTSGLDVTNAGPLNNLFTAFHKGSILLEQSQAFSKLAGLPGEGWGKAAAMAVPRVVELAAKEINLVNDTLNHGLFDVLIPHQKNGAAMNEMALFLRNHPNATWEDSIAAARTITDSIDNRFGELNQDNLFWPRALKQLSSLYTVSLGWELGTLRAFGAAGTALRGLGQLLSGKSPAAMSTATRWLLGFPTALAMSNAMMQYATSPVPVGQGGPAELMKDLFVGGRTGGTNKDGSPERRLMPGYVKEFFDWAWDMQTSGNNPMHAALKYVDSKANPFIQTLYGLATGTIWWNGHNIINKKDSDNDWLQYLKFVAKNAEPIPFQNMEAKPGSEIGPVSRFLGDRPVPHYIQKDINPNQGKTPLQQLRGTNSVKGGTSTKSLIDQLRGRNK